MSQVARSGIACTCVCPTSILPSRQPHYLPGFAPTYIYAKAFFAMHQLVLCSACALFAVFESLNPCVRAYSSPQLQHSGHTTPQPYHWWLGWIRGKNNTYNAAGQISKIMEDSRYQEYKLRVSHARRTRWAGPRFHKVKEDKSYHWWVPVRLQHTRIPQCLQKIVKHLLPIFKILPADVNRQWPQNRPSCFHFHHCAYRQARRLHLIFNIHFPQVLLGL